MVAGRPKLGTLLIQEQILTPEQLDVAVRYQGASNCRLGEALIELGYCSDADVARALAEQLEIPFVDLEQNPPDPECITLLPREVAIEHSVLPIRMEGTRLLMAVLDPYNIHLDEVLCQATGRQISIALAPEGQVHELLRQHYTPNLLGSPLSGASDDLELEEVATENEGQLSVDSLIAAGEQVSTIRVVNSLITDAVRRGASDLHIDPEPERVRVRYRVDGRMLVATSLPTDLLLSIIARIKIMAGMDISENRRPQDGGCSIKVDGQPIEVRISTLRSINGESAVVRILTPRDSLYDLNALGLNPSVYRELRRLLAARNGMLLVTGPTGSGKTTSLYAAVSHLNREDLNIITVEDPVESKITGIKQVQIHDRAGRSFGSSLRAILRQDPDIIMVGEIRDVETADIASRAALTGHLVLSTMHTQDCLGTVVRLLEMGLEPWVVASCLNGVLSQRLVRKVCEDCAADYTPPPGLLRALRSQYGELDGANFRKGQGCNSCLYSGSRGRIGVYELLRIDETTRDMLARGANLRQLRQALEGRGFQGLECDAFRKAYQGLIPPEEILGLGFDVAGAVAADEAGADLEE
jgi:type IV pilus assembly protein PilB